MCDQSKVLLLNSLALFSCQFNEWQNFTTFQIIFYHFKAILVPFYYPFWVYFSQNLMNGRNFTTCNLDHSLNWEGNCTNATLWTLIWVTVLSLHRVDYDFPFPQASLALMIFSHDVWLLCLSRLEKNEVLKTRLPEIQTNLR